MPISGLVIRCVPSASAEAVAERLQTLPALELGQQGMHTFAAVLDAPDYAEHDAALDAVREVAGVCAVDIVFHDFSDVTHFDALPHKQRFAR